LSTQHCNVMKYIKSLNMTWITLQQQKRSYNKMSYLWGVELASPRKSVAPKLKFCENWYNKTIFQPALILNSDFHKLVTPTIRTNQRSCTKSRFNHPRSRLWTKPFIYQMPINGWLQFAGSNSSLLAKLWGARTPKRGIH